MYGHKTHKGEKKCSIFSTTSVLNRVLFPSTRTKLDRDLALKVSSFLVICEMWIVHNVDLKDSGLLGCYSEPIRRNAGMWGNSVHETARFPFYIRFKCPQWPGLWM